MRKLGTAVAVLGLAALGLATPATTAQAGPQGANCDRQWPGRDGYVRAWEHPDCGGVLLGRSQGDDAHWGDDKGGFGYGAGNLTSSVMNSGFIIPGGKDVVAFYYGPAYAPGYICLSPNELYADNLTDDRFTSGHIVDNQIGSHKWVRASDCGNWLR